MNRWTTCRVTGAACAGALLFPVAAMAQFTGTFAAGAQYEVNSNVFGLPKATPYDPPGGLSYGQPGYDASRGQLDDSIQRYIGSLNTAYAAGQQSLFLTGQATSVHYGDFTRFNYTGYNGTTGLNWRMTGKIDGTLQYSRSRTQALATDQTLNPGSINTSSTGLAGLNYQITGRWRLESSTSVAKIETPLYGAPNYEADETIYKLSVLRDAGRQLTLGVSGEWRDGKYKNGVFVASGGGADTNLPYTQLNTALTASYSPGAVTQIRAILGYSQRKSDDSSQQLDATTGSLSYNQQIGGKTTLGLSASRAINAYAASAGSVLDTTFAATLGYRATAKSTFSATVTHGISRISSPQFSDAGTSTATAGFYNRRDVLDGGTLDYTLASRSWLQFRLYGSYQKRDSNYVNYATLDSLGSPIATFDYDGVAYGISVQMTYGNAAR
ncbi:MAG: hypothetical protein QM718_04660 [Steroidobacteraceae bacterium]